MPPITMMQEDEFRSRVQLKQYLASQLKNGKLAIVLGAGISKPFGLPDWNGLVDCLFATVGSKRPGNSPEKDAEYLKNSHFRGRDAEFLDAVSTCLYRTANVEFSTLRQNTVLSAIGALAMASRRGNAGEIITFNYDNLLELYLEYHGFVVHSISSDRHWSKNADVAIYHPHGYLPHDNSDRSKSIVLDRADYSKLIGKDTLWRQALLNVLRRRTCLFLGISGDDNNLDSMLFDCKEGHASLAEQTMYWGIMFGRNIGHPNQVSWNQRGIFCFEITDYETDLAGFLFSICQEAATL